jgi:hypothetical protein
MTSKLLVLEKLQKTHEDTTRRLKLDNIVFQWATIHKVQKWAKCDIHSPEYVAKTATLEHSLRQNIKERMATEHEDLLSKSDV